MRLRKYTSDSLEQAIKSSSSIRGVLQKLGLKEAGGNYITIKKAISFYNIDINHFQGQGHLKGKTHAYNSRSLLEILKDGKNEQTNSLKKRLLKENVKQHICEMCQGKEWLGKPIPLELHHKDGIRVNNNIANLELLCPNCHALTPNYRGKNKKI